MTSTVKKVDEYSIDLPPGFRFHPTDEEIITHYLFERIKDSSFTATAMGEADLNKCEPWDLPGKATMGEKEWYFFCQRDRKYPTGMRTNRATESGYWKATGKDKEIYKGKGYLVGMKKTLVFYKGRAPKGEKTNWVMHEYRLESKSSFWNLPKSAKDEWVVCRVLHKKSAGISNRITPDFNFSPMYNDDGRNFGDGSSTFQQLQTAGATPSSSMDPYQYPYSENYQCRFQTLPGEEDGFNTTDNYYNYYDCNNMIPTPGATPVIRRHCKTEQYSSEMGYRSTDNYDDAPGITPISTSQTVAHRKSANFLHLKCSSDSNDSPSVNHSKLVEEVKVRLEKENPELPLGLKGRDDEEMIGWFLKDRKYSVDDAVTKLRKSIKWRQEFGESELTEESVSDLYQTGKAYVHEHTDVNGRPVLVVVASKHFPATQDSRENEKLCVFLIEKALERLPPGKEDILGIFDLRGFNIENGDISFLIFLIDVFYYYYPRRIGQVLFVGAPFVFQPIWHVVKPLLKSYASLVRFCDAETVTREYFNDKTIPPNFNT